MRGRDDMEERAVDVV